MKLRRGGKPGRKKAPPRVCPHCHRRRILGLCNWGGGRVPIGKHCHGCCSTPAPDGWRPVT